MKQIHFIRLHLVSMQVYNEFGCLFDYFQHVEVFLLARDGVQYPRIFPIHSRINRFTQEILPLLPTKLRTPYSRNLRVPNVLRCKHDS